MNSDTFGAGDTLASARDKKAVAIFDASAFGLSPEKNGEENRVALQTMIDAAYSAGGGMITIPANGKYEIAGEVIVVGAPSGTITITGSGGQAKLVQTGGTHSIFIVGSEDETVPRDVAMKNLWIDCSFFAAGEQRSGRGGNSARHGRQA
jgi:hypothetical protein